MSEVARKRDWKAWVAVFLFFAAVALSAFQQIRESDSFYHLKAGELIWQTKQVPHADVFSYTAAGAMWVTHEWLAELIFYGIWRLGWFWGLLIFVSLLAAAAYAFLLALARRRGGGLYLPMALFLIFGYLTFEMWVPRPQSFAFLSCAALLYFLERWRSERHLPQRAGVFAGRRKFLWAAVAAEWLWANFNASFILGLVILFWYAVAETLPLLSEKLGRPAAPAERKAIWLAALAAFALAFVNPNTYRIFLYSWYIRGVAGALNVLEWKSMLVFLYEPQAKIFLGEMAAAGFFALWWYGWRRGSRDLTALGVMAGVSLLPLISIRHVGFWPMAVLPFFVSGFSARYGAALQKWPRLLWAASVAAALLVIGQRLTAFPVSYYNPFIVPVEAADFIAQNRLPGPYFNLYNEGGYFIWKFWPKERVSIDGRSEVYRGRPLGEFFTILKRSPGWEDLVDKKYNIQLFALPYAPAELAQDTGPLSFALFRKHFHLVYWDDTLMILLRESSSSDAFIAAHDLRHISPFRPPADIPEGEAKAAAAEIKILLEEAPDSYMVRNYAQEFLQTHAFTESAASSSPAGAAGK